VTLHQVNMIALPRRFSLPMQEIWQFQTRFATRQRKRVLRILAHPRFRAAYDFLLLREAATGSHAEDVAFWREAQHTHADELAAMPELAVFDEDGTLPPASDRRTPPRRYPRRRYR